MNVLATQEQLEQKTIARECAVSFGRALEWYRIHFKMTTEEAMARMNENAEEVSMTTKHRAIFAGPPEPLCALAMAASGSLSLIWSFLASST